MHFCALGYSKSEEEKGYTSDNFISIDSLTFEPHFKSYAFQAFYPIGIMVDRWEAWHRPKAEIEIPIKMINDEPETWIGTVTVSLEGGGEKQLLNSREVSIESLGATVYTLAVTTPSVKGNYRLTASFADKSNVINSVYEFEIKDSASDLENGVEAREQFIH